MHGPTDEQIDQAISQAFNRDSQSEPEQLAAAWEAQQEAFQEQRRHRKLFAVSGQFLYDMLQTMIGVQDLAGRVTIHNLPQGATFHGADWSFEHACFLMDMTHPDFERVEDGARAPVEWLHVEFDYRNP